METLQTERLVIRPFSKHDVDDVYHYSKKPNIGPDAGWQPHTSRDETMFFINDFIRKDEAWAIVDKASNRLIGSIGLHSDDKRNIVSARSLGYVLDDEFWGQGIITEACKAVISYGFDHMNLRVISAYHFPHNVRSLRVIEKCGLAFEGTLRLCDALIPSGKYADNMCHSITKEEYLKIYFSNI